MSCQSLFQEKVFLGAFQGQIYLFNNRYI